MPVSREDILVWPCGTWHYREDYYEATSYLSDDFYVLREGTPEWEEFVFERSEYERD
jgi:hypothetical protein